MKTIFNNPFSTSFKALLVIAIFIASSLQSFAGAKLDIHIEFGRRSLGCTRFSICHFAESLNERTNASVENTGKALLFNINRDAFIGHDGQIQNGYFIMEEDCAIGESEKKSLGLPSNAVLRAGKYKAVKTETGWGITIPY